MSTSRAWTAHDPGALGLPLAVGLFLLVPLARFGNAIGSVLRYPDIGSAVLFPPYAALTAAATLRWMFDGPPRLDSLGALAFFVMSAHGGRLWAHNNPGGGATMHCLHVAERSPASAERQGPEALRA